MTGRYALDVTLDADEVRLCRFVGSLRQRVADERRSPESTAGFSERLKPEREQVRQEAAASEYVVARYLGRFWNVTPHGADVYGNVEVKRSTRPDGDLIVDERSMTLADPQRTVFVLVRGSMPRLEIVGWCTAAFASQGRHWDDTLPRPAYRVPAAKLADVALLEAAGDVTRAEVGQTYPRSV